MQETRWNDTDVLTDGVKEAQFKKAMMDMVPAPAPEPAKQNRSVALHAPGSLVTLADGSAYRIGPMGNWIRLDKKSPKKARARARRDR